MSSTLSAGIQVDKGFDVGADDYLIKPIELEELTSRVHSIFDRTLHRKRETILVVEDSKMTQNAIVQALSAQGFCVVTADDGETGLAAAKAERPALILTDSEMPGMNGREMVRELRALPEFKDTPIVMLTARDTQIDRAKAKNAGVSGFISKPFVSDKVLVLIERVLAESKLKREQSAMKCYLSEAAMEHAAEMARDPQDGTIRMSAYSRDVCVLFTDIC